MPTVYDRECTSLLLDSFTVALLANRSRDSIVVFVLMSFYAVPGHFPAMPEVLNDKLFTNYER